MTFKPGQIVRHKLDKRKILILKIIPVVESGVEKFYYYCRFLNEKKSYQFERFEEIELEELTNKKV